VLGWPENPPRGKLVDVPEPKKSDYVSYKIRSDNPVKSYTDHEIIIEKSEGRKLILHDRIRNKIHSDE